ncbi:hypothetical protein [Aquitalea denitrificans]|uniref:hypothetical protein n=1 Tax=Aquitalea denitrificans TaxID=519081 RepID=UPI001359BDFA|nr:hypothetical protein [Aquitalea denitrificans]
MPGARRKQSRSETQCHYREGVIHQWEVTAYIDPAPVHRQIYLEMSGELTEPFAGVSRFSISTHVDRADGSNGSMGAVGYFIEMKHELTGVVSLTRDEFQLLQMLASGGNLKSCSFSFQQTARSKAVIVSFSFSSKLPDDAEDAGVPAR